MSDIKKGFTFIHAYQLAPGEGKDGKHATCTVTRVAKGLVYFRNESGYLSRVRLSDMEFISK